MNVFHAFGSFFEALWKGISTPAGHQKIEKVLDEIKEIMPLAVAVVKEIDALAPHRTLDEIIDLAERFQVEAPVAKTIVDQIDVDPATGGTGVAVVVTKALLSEVHIHNFLQNLAVKVLAQAAPALSASSLNTAITLAVSLVRA